MKKRIISLLLALVMLLSLMPVSALAEASSIDDYFAGLPVTANPGTGVNKWKVSSSDQTVVMSGNKSKAYSSSTLTLTFTANTQLSFEYKVSSEEGCDKCTITLGSKTLVNGESGNGNWTGLQIDAKIGDTLTVTYKKDSGDSGNCYDDCVYLRNFSVGTPLVVTFRNGSDTPYTQNIYGGKGTLKANEFTSADKVFAGWATSEDGEVAYKDGTEITVEADTDLYAVWSDAYKVTFDNNGDISTVLIAQGTAIGDKTPAAPTRKGYIFGGWFSGDEQLSADTVIGSNITYIAKWTPISYTIAFDANGGTGTVDSIQATYDEEVTLPGCDFTRDGYTFNSWGSYKAGEKVKNLTDKDGGSVTLRAAWKGKPVQVTVDPNYEGAETTERTGVVGSNYNYAQDGSGTVKYNELKDPTRNGYIFKGWFDAAKGGNKIDYSYNFTAADAENGVTLYAHWEKGITVHFDGNGYNITIADKTVTPDKVSSSLPDLSSYYYPTNKALDGWYIRNADGSFGEKVTAGTVFSGDEVTLIAKWRDYQYIIKYNVKYSDKSSVTGTMDDQTAPFGQNVTLAQCTYEREGYDFAGWAESNYGTVKYKDGVTINREFVDDDWDGSEDNEPYNLYAVWTEKPKSEEQLKAEEKLSKAEAAISDTYNAKYGKDENALTMIRAKLTAAGITDVTVSMKDAVYSNYVGIAEDGTLQYMWSENGTTGAEGRISPTIVMSYGSYTKESTGCTFVIGLDEAKIKGALQAILDRISVPETVAIASDLDSLPKYALKEGVDESKVDYNKSNDLELWSTVSWTSSETSVISISPVGYPPYSPYKVSISQPRTDTEVTLTATIVYNGRDDLKSSKVFTVTVKGTADPSAFSYQELLETALSEFGLTDPKNGNKISYDNVTSDIRFPTTKQLNEISLRDYNKSFDGKYTPILLCTSNDSVIVSADPGTANTARMVTYRPLPGKSAETVTVTIKILDRSSVEDKDYTSMKVLASEDITLTVKPFEQSELDTAAAFMQKVCTEDVYWEGIKSANTDKGNVKSDLRPFIEIVPEGEGYKFIRTADDYSAVGVKTDELGGWYASELYRCFRSSVPSVVAHENLLVTKPTYNTSVKIDSVLSYTEYAKYYKKFGSDPAYAQFAKFYKQPVSTTVTVIGTAGTSAPAEKQISVSVSVDGSIGSSVFKSLSGSFSCDAQAHKTAADALISVLNKNGYSYTGSASYITGVTDSKGTTLAADDKAHGSWSGWMFTVNGKMPILSGNAETGNVVYATLATYELKSGDSIRFYYVNCPTGSGDHSWSGGTVSKQPTCKEAGVRSFTCSTCGDTHIETIAKLTEHSWDSGVITTAPTTSSEGVKTFTCTVCGTTKTEAIAKLTECDGGKDCPSHAFKDVDAILWYHECIDYAVSNKLFKGTGSDTFAPDGYMNRAMAVTVLWRSAGCPKTETASAFNDIVEGAYYAEAVAWAAQKDIVLGTSKTTFAPDENVTREQMALILFRYAKLCGKLGSADGDLSAFADAESVSAYALDAMVWAVKNGIILGIEKDKGVYLLDPQGSATRAQTAAVFMRYAQNIG